MSVYDNMAYGLRNRGMPKDEIERRVAEAAKLLGIDTFLERKPRELSGGQRQRVAMGRAIVREPQAFLFDEPLSNLDAKLRVQMRVEIRRLHNRLKATSIFVTHDQVEAMTLADRVVVMNAGRIEQIGAPTEVYRRPATRFVASFIGSPAMNLMPGRVVGAGVVETGGGRIGFDRGRVRCRRRPRRSRSASARRTCASARGGEGELAFAKDFVEELGATRLVPRHRRHCAAGRSRSPRRRATPAQASPPTARPCTCSIPRPATACGGKTQPWSDRSSFWCLGRRKSRSLQSACGANVGVDGWSAPSSTMTTVGARMWMMARMKSANEAGGRKIRPPRLAICHHLACPWDRMRSATVDARGNGWHAYSRAITRWCRRAVSRLQKRETTHSMRSGRTISPARPTRACPAGAPAARPRIRSEGAPKCASMAVA